MMNPNTIAVFAFAAVLCPAAALADPVTGECKPDRVKFMASEELPFRKTLSTQYIDLPQARVTFRQGGQSASCVLVRFSAVPDATRNTLIRVVLDGTEQALPYEVQLVSGEDLGANARAFTFVFPSVAPGDHTIQIQYNKLSLGGFADMNAHNTIVWFAR